MTAHPSLAEVESKLASLSLGATQEQVLSHPTSDSPEAYKAALASASLAASAKHLKTLVFKPKTAKTAKPVPVVIVAREETETVTGALGKKIDQKDMRLAAPELLQEFFQANKDESQLLVVTYCHESMSIDVSTSLLTPPPPRTL